jgi:hypothetical protein
MLQLVDLIEMQQPNEITPRWITHGDALAVDLPLLHL